MSRLGRTLFAIALVGLGAEHVIFQEFVTGRAPPWPAGLAGQGAWAYLTAVVVAGSGVALLAGKGARPAALLTGALVLVWALIRHVPIIAADSVLAPSWTDAGKALAFFGGAWAIAGTLPRTPANRDTRLGRFLNATSPFIVLGRISLGVFLIITGIQHFMFTPFVASLVPDWIPGTAVFWTYFAGVALMAGGVGLQVPGTARLAALLSGVMVFSWFWIVHVPRTFLNVSSAIAVFEALAVSGIAFALAGALGADRSSRPGPAGELEAAGAGAAAVGAAEPRADRE